MQQRGDIAKSQGDCNWYLCLLQNNFVFLVVVFFAALRCVLTIFLDKKFSFKNESLSVVCYINSSPNYSLYIGSARLNFTIKHLIVIPVPGFKSSGDILFYLKIAIRFLHILHHIY